jgi:hypothetical protein
LSVPVPVGGAASAPSGAEANAVQIDAIDSVP